MCETQYENTMPRKEIHVFFLLDNSGSMTGARIHTLNETMRSLIPAMVSVAESRCVILLFHALCFNTGFHWLFGSTAEEGVPMDEFHWHEIDAGGTTCTADAIRAVLPGLSRRLLGRRTFRPIVILLTDGYSNDRKATMAAIEELNGRKRTTRIAIGVGQYDTVELDAFASTGNVVTRDPLNAEAGSITRQNLVFSVTEASQIASVLTAASLSSLVDTLDHPNAEYITVSESSLEWE